jgi:hypothetical protein
MKFLPLLLLAILVGCAHEKNIVQPTESKSAEAAITAASTKSSTTAVRAEQIRTDCIKGRRLICGKVLKVSPNGLVVDSGYTDLLRPPLTQSWVIPGTVSVSRNPDVLELNTPGTPCIGLVFITDIPKRQKVHKFDYVILMGYPAGQYAYIPAPNVKKTIRKFSAGLDTAVKLKLKAEANNS